MFPQEFKLRLLQWFGESIGWVFVPRNVLEQNVLHLNALVNIMVLNVNMFDLLVK